MARKALRLKILKIIASAAVLIITLPLFIFIKYSVLYGPTVLSFAVYALTAVSIHFFGMFMSYWNKGVYHQKKSKKMIAVLSKLAVVFSIVPLTIYTFVFELNPAVFIYSIPLSIIPFISGYISYNKSYTEIFTREWLVAFLVIDLLSYIMYCNIGEEINIEAGRMAYLIITGIVIIITCVLTNQTNIDNQIKQRRDNIVLIPKGLRSFNTGLIAIIAVIMIICFCFTGYVSEWIGNVAKSFVAWLVSLKYGDEDVKSDYNSDDTISQYLLDSGNNDFVGMIITIVFYLVVAFIVIKYGRRIVSSIIRFFRNYFKELLERFSKTNDEDSSVPFIDEFEDIYRVKADKRKSPTTVRELVKLYRGEENDAEKFRYGYRLLLMLVNEKRHSLTPYDTTDIQSEKSLNAYDMNDEIQDIVQTYNKIRYMNTFPQKTDLVKMENLLNNIL